MILYDISLFRAKQHQTCDSLGVDWPYCPGRNAENGPLHTCIYSGGKIWNLARFTYFYTYTCMHKWLYAISIPFIRVNIKLVMLFLVFGWAHGLGRGAGNGRSYTCICSGGQMEKLSRVTYMQYMSFQTHFLSSLYTFQTILNTFCKNIYFYYETLARVTYMRYMSPQRHICHSSEWHIRYMRWHICLTYGSHSF